MRDQEARLSELSPSTLLRRDFGGGFHRIGLGFGLLLTDERNILADVPPRRRPLSLGVVSLHRNVRSSVPSVGSPDVGLFSTCDIGKERRHSYDKSS